MTTRTIDLNADVGEGSPHDAELIPLVTSANIACGAHAGDEQTMNAAARLAIDAGVAIGAHPGHADREHFGRRELPIAPDEAASLVANQYSRLVAVVERCGGAVRYIKPHGGLYHQAGRDPDIAAAIAGCVAQLADGLALLAQPGSALEAAARKAGVPFYAEAFADRLYQADGTLAPRSLAGAVLTDPAAAAGQAVSLATRGEAATLDGPAIPVRCDSLCLHGDGPHAAAIAAAVRSALQGAGVSIRSFTGSETG
ncbi:MAG: 5-oxoprolinase subunit PxpA [Planctomycetota bacterium]